MSSETSGGFSTATNQAMGTGRAGSAGAGASAPAGAAKESAQEIGHGVKSAAAGVHGLGEKIRGTAGAAVDRAMNDPEGSAKNERVVREGEQEMTTGDFSHNTREREGLPHSERGMGTQRSAGTAKPPPDYY
ncbi:hypothetical protein FQN49_004316 [Arthroderma sp. PD_2]|nr:hypothetical protein FQN49_004316 [Arthroderma sp. PD_2]